MYKMCNTQWDKESDDDDRNSLNSSFWSDGGKQEEEEVEIEGVIDSKLVDGAEDSLQEASGEETPDLKNQGNLTGESLEEGSDDDDENKDEDEEEQDDDNGEEEDEEEDEEEEDEDEVEEEEEEEDDNDEEESCRSSSDSPAPSLMTSGYGTYRPEEQEGGDYRDDHTITEFDQDSRGDLSEMRDDEEDDRWPGGFGEFDVQSTHEPDFYETPMFMFEDDQPVANVACCGDDGPHEEMDMDITNTKPEEEKEQAGEEKCEEDLYPVANTTSEEELPHVETEDNLLLDERHLKDGSDLKEGGELAEVHELSDVEEEVEDKVESEDPDEASSNKDIKFIDSKEDFSWMTYDKMCEEWEGNLRQKKDAASCLEERLADLQLSTSARQDFEAEHDDRTDQSDTRSSESDGISLSAFESYVRGMTRSQSDGDLRPKPKSFIRPVMSQQTIKKTDPVAKYFQYKQLWDMFKLPGETDRRALRLEIKERLAYQPPPPKPRRVYVPNTYIVPTEKKRSALRWEIRNDLANGLLPHKFSYRF